VVTDAFDDREPGAAGAAADDGRPEASGETYRVHLEEFDGPLDLLLYLIRKEEVSIYDIPIARLTEQYLVYLRLMEELDIDLAGEFLVMAATLIHIKSKMLLPRDPANPAEAEELEDPRQELVDRLLEHQRYKAAAEVLYERRELEREAFPREPAEEERVNDEVNATVFDLLTAFREIMLRAQALVEIEIARDEVTLAQKLAEVRGLVEMHGAVSVLALFESSKSRRELVITLLAILELVKLSYIRITQTEDFGDILARRREPPADEPDADGAAADAVPAGDHARGTEQ
jgi:segregation and condensation protein A